MALLKLILAGKQAWRAGKAKRNRAKRGYAKASSRRAVPALWHAKTVIAFFAITLLGPLG